MYAGSLSDMGASVEHFTFQNPQERSLSLLLFPANLKIFGISFVIVAIEVVNLLKIRTSIDREKNYFVSS